MATYEDLMQNINLLVNGNGIDADDLRATLKPSISILNNPNFTTGGGQPSISYNYDTNKITFNNFIRDGNNNLVTAMSDGLESSGNLALSQLGAIFHYGKVICASAGQIVKIPKSEVSTMEISTSGGNFSSCALQNSKVYQNAIISDLSAIKILLSNTDVYIQCTSAFKVTAKQGLKVGINASIVLSLPSNITWSNQTDPRGTFSINGILYYGG